MLCNRISPDNQHYCAVGISSKSALSLHHLTPIILRHMTSKIPSRWKTRFTGLRAGEVCVWRRYVVCMSLCVIYMNSFIQNRWREDDKHRKIKQKEEKPPKSTSRKPSTNQLINSFFHSLRIIQTTDQLSTMFMAIILPSTRLRTLKQEKLHPGWNIHI